MSRVSIPSKSCWSSCPIHLLPSNGISSAQVRTAIWRPRRVPLRVRYFKTATPVAMAVNVSSECCCQRRAFLVQSRFATCGAAHANTFTAVQRCQTICRHEESTRQTHQAHSTSQRATTAAGGVSFVRPNSTRAVLRSRNSWQTIRAPSACSGCLALARSGTARLQQCIESGSAHAGLTRRACDRCIDKRRTWATAGRSSAVPCCTVSNSCLCPSTDPHIRATPLAAQ